MKLITKGGVVSLGDFPSLASGFGSAPDGTPTLDGTNTYSWANKSGSGNGAVYTLLRSVACSTLTVGTSSNAITLKTNGYRIYTGTLTVTNGIISCDGNTGTAGSGSNPGAGGTVFGSLGSGTTPVPDPMLSNWGGVGGTGGTGGGLGSSGAAGSALAPSFGGAGGKGGSGGGSGNPAGGAASAPAGSYVAFQNLTSPILGLCGLLSGAGGGGGGGGGSSTSGVAGGGGGGGGGAGLVSIFAGTISLASRTSITSKGGTGGTGAAAGSGNASGGGGGGGGGGGLIALAYQTLTNNGSLSVSGGPGGPAGSGIGGGAAGATGATGVDGTILKFNVTGRVFE